MTGIHNVFSAVMVRAVALGVSLGAVGVVRAQNWVTYDPALGTLPDKQCWTFVGSATPAPALVGGGVKQGPISTGGTQYYARTDVPIDFDVGVSVEMRVRIDSSQYTTNCGQRSGYYLFVQSTDGRVLLVGLSDGSIHLRQQDPGPANAINPRVLVTNDQQYHDYRLVIAKGVASLARDGAVILTTNLLARPAGSGQSFVGFGDLSVCAGGSFSTGRVRLTGTPTGGATVTTQPRNEVTCSKRNPRFTVAASAAQGTGTLAYRWRLNGVPLNDGPAGLDSVVVGARTSELTIQNMSRAMIGVYDCVVTPSLAACAPVTSRGATLVLSPADIAQVDGTLGEDGQLTASDVVAFFSGFFSGVAGVSDVANQDGTLGPDGKLTASDVVVFFNAFFVGCP